MHTQYLGATEVTKTHGPGSTDDAVKKIVHHVSKAHTTTYLFIIIEHSCSQDLDEPDSFKLEAATEGLLVKYSLDVPPPPPVKDDYYRGLQLGDRNTQGWPEGVCVGGDNYF